MSRALVAGFASALLMGPFSHALRAQQGNLLSRSIEALYGNNFAQSEALAARYTKAYPADSRGWVMLARAHMAQGRLDAAYQSFLRALRANPKDPDALYYMSRLCLALSQGQFERLYAMAPNSARVHQLLAESHKARQDLAKAEEEYLAALRADPQLVEVLNALGDMKRGQFKFDEAIACYQQASAIQPRDYDSAYGLGAAYIYRQEPERAIEHLQRALSIDPSSAPARLALGDALLRSGRAAEAVSALRAAVGLNPEMRQAFVLLARAHNRLGQKEEASQALARAQELQKKESKSLAEMLGSDDAVALPPLPAEAPEKGEPSAQ